MVKFRQLLWISLISALLFSGVAHAQTTLTQVKDTVLNSDSSLFNGTVVITWNGFTNPGGSASTPLSTSARVYGGALSVLLVPTTTATGAFYQVVYTSTDGTITWTETWQVAPSTTPLTLSQVRTSTTQGSSSGSGTTGTGTTGTGSGGQQYATLPISISQVTSLGSDLASINSAIASLAGQVTALTNQMGSVGTSQGSAANFVDADTLAGTANGTNSTFTLSQTPIASTTLNLYRNGLLQSTGVDYTISGSTVTFLSTGLPRSGDVLAAYYRVPGTGPLASFVDAETPAGTIDGVNLTFTLSIVPNPALSLKLYKNGVLLTANADYTLSGNTITFNSAAVGPVPGDTLLAAYRH